VPLCKDIHTASFTACIFALPAGATCNLRPIFPFTFDILDKGAVNTTKYTSHVVLWFFKDKSVRLWDLRTPVCQAVLQLPGQPLATFDQQGLVFAVATDSGIIKLYDVTQYSAGPFDAFVVSLEQEGNAFRYCCSYEVCSWELLPGLGLAASCTLIGQ
jgi:hypothetical protein